MYRSRGAGATGREEKGKKKEKNRICFIVLTLRLRSLLSLVAPLSAVVLYNTIFQRQDLVHILIDQ